MYYIEPVYRFIIQYAIFIFALIHQKYFLLRVLYATALFVPEPLDYCLANTRSFSFLTLPKKHGFA